VPASLLSRAILAILVLDVTVMSVGFHYTGGVMSPYVYLYILPILMGGVLLSDRHAWLLAFLEGGQITLLTAIEQRGLWLPTTTLGGHHVGQSPPIQVAEAILAVWGMCGLTAFIYAYTANRLHRQERRLLAANQALQARSREMEALNQVSDAVRESLDPHEVMTRALQAALGVTGLDAGWFVLGDGHEVWELPVAYGLTEAMLRAERDTPPTSACICVRAFDTGQIQHATTMLVCPRLAQETIVESGLRRHISVPLKAGDQVLGVLNLASSNPHREFSPEELRLLEVMGTQIGVALANARLFQETQQRAEELERLYRVAVAASQSLDLESVLESALDEALSIPLLEGRGGIFLLDEEEKVLRLAARRNLPPDFLAQEETVPLGECLCGLAAQSRESCIARGDDPRHTRPCHFPAWTHINVPILGHNQVLGVLFVYARPEHPVTPQEQRLLETLGQQIGLAVVNARLYAAEQERRRVAETLRQMAGLVSSSLALEEVLDLALIALRQIVPYTTASIFLREDDTMVLTAARGFEEPERVLGRRISLEEGTLSADIVRDKAPILLDDVRRDPRWLVWEETAHVRAWLGV
ncbi:MAG: GAF domain-containing protein, partial [Chloroflexi bacterium]